MIQRENTTPSQLITEYYLEIHKLVYELAGLRDPAAVSLLLAELIKTAAKIQLDILPLISAHISVTASAFSKESKHSQASDLAQPESLSELKVKFYEFEDQFTTLRKNKRFSKQAVGRAQVFLGKNSKLITTNEWHILPEVLKAFASCINKKELYYWGREHQISFNFDQTGPETLAVLHEAAQMLLDKHRTSKN